MTTLEKHPDWFYDFYPMEILLLGSFPPHSSKHAFPFYYPNKQNRFWKILAHIANKTLTHDLSNTELAVNERKNLMKFLHIGIHDVGKTILRKNNSSLDTKIDIIEFQDIKKIVKNHPELQQILLLGFSSKNSATQTFIKYLEHQKILAEFPVDFKLKSQQSFTIFIDNRKIKCSILNSTSSASAIGIDALIDQFSKYILVPNE
ncbi:hypothetical protein [Flavobacterium croceum]|uniref:hypothetical protein n=1 Tax=Flavobacterium croceum TaxID=370975 RepID=UPI0024A88259|nr:hypothetical protein [Flavobacterium croceum]